MEDQISHEPSNEAEQAYEVGYGRPPLEIRFQKGRSGNPKGRPVGSKNIETLLTAALNEPLAVNENGKRRKISKREVIIRQLVNKSAAADLKAIQMVIALLQQVEARQDAPSMTEVFEEADEQVMQQVRERLAQARGGDHA
jgi:hypothetical protein